MPDHFYVYPAYLTRTIARSDGRRVAASDALPDVTADEIVAAAKHLGYKAEGESGKQYPRQFFAYAGRVYPSLSAVAKAVTGSHTNGFLFFRNSLNHNKETT